ncbi:MAG: DUF2391 family protein [Nanoarchaeota archaeon]|nr:DUF2391 family protein [Nanoarchaeota archaeon]
METKKREQKIIFKEMVDPFFHEFHLKDVLQVIIGASILAIPVGFTREVWEFGETLPMINIFGFMILSLLFISLFTYYHYHREHGLKKYHKHFTRRVILTYVLSFFVVAVILSLIQKAPWQTDWVLAFKRIVLVTFPASMSGTIADAIK